MYRVTCAAILVAPWLILASIQAAEATNINVRGDLKYSPTAPENDTCTGFHIGGGIGLAAFQAYPSAAAYRAAILIGWCYTQPRSSDGYIPSKTSEVRTQRELVLLSADGKAVTRRQGWKWGAV